MNNNNIIIEKKQINTAMIKSCKEYQRPLNAKQVAKIVSEWDDNLVNAPKVSYRDGRYWVFDGQHTIAAMKQRHGGRDLLVDCLVWHGLTLKQEAEFFIQQNGVQRPVYTNEKFRALFNMGDPDICGMVRAAGKQHCAVDFAKRKIDGRCVAVKKLYEIYMQYTRSQYDEVLRIIYESWGGVATGYSSQIIGGMALFVKTFDGEYSHAVLVKKLKSISPIKLIRDGSAGYGNGDKKYAHVIFDIYNKNQTKYRLEEKF